jgi:hypothetical protein
MAYHQMAEAAPGRKTPPAEGSGSEQKQPAALSDQQAAEQDQEEVSLNMLQAHRQLAANQ